MVPSALVVLEAMPLSPNGKVDRKALPEPEYMEREYEAPVGEVEEVLARIWEDVLGVECVGRHTNFFELGGDSILSLQIVAKAREVGWKVTPRDLFEQQTISLLAGTATRADTSPRAQLEVVGEVPLLPIQTQFFATPMVRRHHWNQSVLLASREPLDIAVLGQALKAVLGHHGAFGLRFKQDGAGQWTQAYAGPDDGDVLLIRQDVKPEQVGALCNEAQRSLDLVRGPLMRALAMEVVDGSWRLLLAIHHLVVDGVSWRVLLEDLQTTYGQLRAGVAAKLPAASSPYQAWARKLAGYAKSEAVRTQLPYWQAVLSGPAQLPCERPLRAATVRHARSVKLQLDPATTQRLLQEAPAAYRTQVNDLLLTALGRALCAWTGGESVRIDVEGHGREDVFEDIDLSRTVGWFTSLFPVNLEPLGDPGAALMRVKEMLRGVPGRGLGYGLLRHLGDGADREALAQAGPSQVVFNYLGQFDQSFDERAMWKPAAESAGETVDGDAPMAHELSVNGQVYGGELALTVSYSGERYEQQTIEALMERYRSELEGLVAHCTSGATGVTPADFPVAGLSQSQIELMALPWRDIQDIYPATPLQSGLLFHSLLDGDSGVYVNQKRFTLRGALDGNILRSVWEAEISQHPILRTHFTWTHGGDALQVVRRQVTLPYMEHDWSREPPAAYDARLNVWMQDDLARGFDLGEAPLLRINLFIRPDGQHDLVWTDHHVLMDGWSSTQLFGEVLQRYRARMRGEPVVLPAAPSFRDYVEWLGAQVDPRSWWEKQLVRLNDPATLTGSLPTPAVATQAKEVRVQQHDDVLDERLSAVLHQAAQRYRVTLNTLIQGAWAILLSRYGNRDQVAFGVTMSGRENDLPGVDRILGLFINSLPLWTDVPGGADIGDWLRALQLYSSELRAHEATPLNRVQQWSGRSGDALFDSLLVFENYPVDEAVRKVDIGLTLTHFSAMESTHYAMVLAVLPGERIGLRWKYQPLRFGEAMAQRLRSQYRSILKQMVDGTTTFVGDVTLPVDREWHRARADHGFSSVVGRVSARAAQMGHARAVVCEGESLSYERLEAWS
ncbi:condensation domain-containing protein, partial [Paraburkholderia sp. BCC1885]|uniref:condensation domain-containing protein n=1 Tax=Paraburkholderia sp. BCC1885 TaxID=2562669 RepID=UPI0021B425ED